MGRRIHGWHALAHPSRGHESAGLWAPWCLAEDSDLAIRIHAHGYASFNLARTLDGRARCSNCAAIGGFSPAATASKARTIDWRGWTPALCAHASLRHVTEWAALRALFGRRRLRWHPTDKRRAPHWRHALGQTAQESLRATVWLALAAWMASLAFSGDVVGVGPALALLLAGAMALVCLSAPVLALWAKLTRPGD